MSMETKERPKPNSKKISFELSNYSEVNNVIKNNGITMSYYINLAARLLLHLYDAKINYIESEELRNLRILAVKQNAEVYDEGANVHDIMGKFVWEALSVYLAINNTQIKDQSAMDVLKKMSKKEKLSLAEKISQVVSAHVNEK